MSFTAKYKGVCTECDEWFNAGDEIRSTTSGYAHDECPELTEKPTKFVGTDDESMGF